MDQKRQKNKKILDQQLSGNLIVLLKQVKIGSKKQKKFFLILSWSMLLEKEKDSEDQADMCEFIRAAFAKKMFGDMGPISNIKKEFLN